MSTSFRKFDTDALAAPETTDLRAGSGAGYYSRSPDAPPPSTLHPLTSLRNHKWLALGVFVLVILAGLPVIAYKDHPKYLAEAVIYVSPHFIKTLQEDREVDVQAGEYRNFVAQQVKTIDRYDVVEAALAKLGDKRALWQNTGETDRRATQRLQSALDIHPVQDTYQVAVDLTGDRPEGLAEIVNAVVDTYLTTAKQEEFYEADKRLTDLRAQQHKLEQEVARRAARRTELANVLGVTAFTDAYPNPYDRLMTTMRDVLSELRRKRFEAVAHAEANNLPNGPDRAKAIRAYAYELASKDPAVMDLFYYTDNRRTTLLTATAGLGPQHPNRKAAEQEIAAIEAEESKLIKRVTDLFVNVLSQEHDAEAYRTKQVERQMEAEVQDMQTKASWYSRQFQEGLSLGQEIERLRKQLDAIDDRVNYLTTESHAPGFVRLFAKALPPDMPGKSNRRKYLAMLLVAGAFLGMMAAVGADMLDPRVKMAGDVEGVLGIPLLGSIPDNRIAAAPAVRLQVMRLANRLALEQRSNGSRVIAFTGVKSGVGTTSVVTELAAALARQGVPSLAVEANAQHADERYAKPGGSRGLTSALRGADGLEAVIVRGSENFPDHVPVGSTDGIPNLPDLFRLMDVLQTGASTYQALLLNLPPIVSSVDAEYIAAAADVVVLVVAAGNVTKPELRAAARTLEYARPRAVAVVLNRVPSTTGYV